MKATSIEWLFAERLTLGSTSSQIGLVTLWSPQKLYSALPPYLYRVMGNLYTPEGVNHIARNILSHPKEIRALVVCGSPGELRDTRSRDALLEWQITDPMIPMEAQEWLREKIRVLECERDVLVHTLEQENRRLAAIPSEDVAPRVFPFPDRSSVSFPSELAGMTVRGNSVYDVWIKGMALVMRFGVKKQFRWEIARELLNLVCVIDGQGEERFPEYVTAQGAEDYVSEFLSPDKSPDVIYSYGHRLRTHFGYDQIERTIAKLLIDPSSRQAVSVVWDSADYQLDTPEEHPVCPCLITLQANIVDGKLFLTSHFRAHDMYGGFYLDLYGLRRLQGIQAMRLGCEVGALTNVTTSAWISELDYDRVTKAISRYKDQHWCELDRRGNVAITVRDGQLVAILYSPTGEWLEEYTGHSAQEVLSQMLAENALGQAARPGQGALGLYST